MLSILSLSYGQACPIGKYWVNGFPRSEYERADGTPYSAAQVTGHCRSKGKNYDFWISKLNNGAIKSWSNKLENFRSWNQTDIEIVMDAFDKVPTFLWRDVRIFRGINSAAGTENLASSEPGFIVIYDRAINQHKSLPRVLSHELAHEVFRKMDLIDSTSYLQIAEWKLNKNDTFSTKRKRFVAPDGDIGPGEDFANNLEYFIYDKKQLKQKSPAIYDWFQIEYGDKIKQSEVMK